MDVCYDRNMDLIIRAWTKLFSVNRSQIIKESNKIKNRASLTNIKLPTSPPC